MATLRGYLAGQELTSDELEIVQGDPLQLRVEPEFDSANYAYVWSLTSGDSITYLPNFDRYGRVVYIDTSRTKIGLDVVKVEVHERGVGPGIAGAPILGRKVDEAQRQLVTTRAGRNLTRAALLSSGSTGVNVSLSRSSGQP